MTVEEEVTKDAEKNAEQDTAKDPAISEAAGDADSSDAPKFPRGRQVQTDVKGISFKLSERGRKLYKLIASFINAHTDSGKSVWLVMEQSMESFLRNNDEAVKWLENSDLEIPKGDWSTILETMRKEQEKRQKEVKAAAKKKRDATRKYNNLLKRIGQESLAGDQEAAQKTADEIRKLKEQYDHIG